jgi:hypothetical protein
MFLFPCEKAEKLRHRTHTELSKVLVDSFIDEGFNLPWQNSDFLCETSSNYSVEYKKSLFLLSVLDFSL